MCRQNLSSWHIRLHSAVGNPTLSSHYNPSYVSGPPPLSTWLASLYIHVGLCVYVCVCPYTFTSPLCPSSLYLSPDWSATLSTPFKSSPETRAEYILCGRWKLSGEAISAQILKDGNWFNNLFRTHTQGPPVSLIVQLLVPLVPPICGVSYLILKWRRHSSSVNSVVSSKQSKGLKPGGVWIFSSKTKFFCLIGDSKLCVCVLWWAGPGPLPSLTLLIRSDNRWMCYFTLASLYPLCFFLSFKLSLKEQSISLWEKSFLAVLIVCSYVQAETHTQSPRMACTSHLSDVKWNTTASLGSTIESLSGSFSQRMHYHTNRTSLFQEQFSIGCRFHIFYIFYCLSICRLSTFPFPYC